MTRSRSRCASRAFKRRLRLGSFPVGRDATDRSFYWIVAALVLAGAGPASAQEVGVQGLFARNNTEDLVSTSGAEIYVQGRRIPVRLSFGSQGGRDTGPFVFCSWLIPPGTDCTPQPTAVRAELRTVALGYEAALERGSWELAAVPQIGILSIRSTWTSRTSENRRMVDDFSATVGGSIEASRRFHSAVPLRFSLGVRGLVVGRSWSHCEDCWVPAYDQGFTSGGILTGARYGAH